MTRNAFSLWVLALCCLLPTASRAEHLNLRVTWSDMHTDAAPGLRASEPSVVSAAIRPGTTVWRREPRLDEDLVVVGLDAAGRERYRVVVKDPTRVRAEIFEPGTGQFLERHLVRRPVEELRLELPMDESVRRLMLYRPELTANGQSLERIADLVLPEPTREGALLASEAAAAATLSTIIQNGDPSKRVDLVLIGDGYTAAEVEKFSDDVQNVLNGFFAFEPFASYAGLFNVYSVFVASNESGADHLELEPDVLRDTAFDSSFGCNGSVARLMCADNITASIEVAALLPLGSRDVILILVNDPTPGGSSLPVISTNAESPLYALHELGHSLGNLDDEYAYDEQFCRLVEPAGFNVTTVTERESIKWSHWIGERTPIPTDAALTGIPGLYTGARYCPTGMYRATFDSMMRTLGAPFYAVNEEAIVRRLYDFARPLDSFSPATNQVTLSRRQSMDFSITAPITVGITIHVDWVLNGVLKQSGTNYTYRVSGAELRPGPDGNTLEARVRDTTDRVRFDVFGRLSETQRWTITLGR